ncbi:MAG: hypothetical protein A2W17_02710 [Planctomycetes bacterium RBG_16_41_13]|nr:MAG: hypothetical protein A2W17_02710 [Planctomycetes bacterium RBG_16_41_13]
MPPVRSNCIPHKEKHFCNGNQRLHDGFDEFRGSTSGQGKRIIIAAKSMRYFQRVQFCNP